MIISVNWLKQFTDISISIEELTTIIGARLVEIEGVVDLGQKYKDVLVVKVVECAPLEGTDHLNLTKIDDGGVAKDVERDANGLVQVVCGAPNVREGIFAAWLPVGSIVPETFNDVEPFVLTAKNLRGTVSNGMLASTRELALGDSHDGIVEINLPDVKPGDSFAALYQLDDYLLDIENKSLTHRPDAFGIIGFAREVAAITGQAFHTPAWLADSSVTIGEAHVIVEPPKIVIDDSELSRRYQGVVLSRDETVSDTSTLTLMQTMLSRSGIRPISPIVDVTNYLMLLSGQPLHAFDYDKLRAVAGDDNTIHVRSARVDETLALLDGRTITLDPSDIVIAAGQTAVALAGAMGGIETEIDDSTTHVFLESATFNLYNLRSTQMRHGVFSEAVTRVTKGQPAGLTAPVLVEATKLLNDYAGLQTSSPIVEAYPGQSEPIRISLSIDDINALLGTQLVVEDVVALLERVEFVVEVVDNQLVVTAPFWRSDIHIPEDIIEEVGRIGGFDSINPTLPTRDFTAVAPSPFDIFRASFRKALVRAGTNEVLTYSFVHGDILQKVGQVTDDSYRVTNSISPDLQYYRQSLTPSLLQLVHPNVKNGFDSFALFEMNKVHPRQRGITDEEVPNEANALALTIVRSKKDTTGASFYDAKHVLEFVAERVGLTVRYEALTQEVAYPTARPFEYRRSAAIIDVRSGIPIGMVGEYRSAVAKNFKLPSYVAGFELDIDAMFMAAQQSGAQYSPLSRYPSTERDICFQVASDVAYAQIIGAVDSAIATSEFQTVVSPIDIYQPESGETKNITVRIKLTPLDRTLTNQEITDTVNGIIESVQTTTNAHVI